ncbi:Ubiquitin-like-conjugating enzyme ATG3 [Aphelenchoides fujianensis]|nr:Ubiquitin-like-conjugating enzyme ATG3 [Aphelenchoides fujianensis]
MQDLFNSVKSAALSVGEKFVPVLKETKFKETGVLTPGGVRRRRATTSSTTAPRGRGRRPPIPRINGTSCPADKPFLITRRVPCHRRCAQIAYNSDLELVIKDEESQEEWVDTHHFYAADNAEKVEDAPAEAAAAALHTVKLEDDDEDDDAPAVDMDDFVQAGSVQAEDPNCFKPSAKDEKAAESEDKIIRTRTYDLHITYDKYYQVPRMWLVGYDETDKLLTVDQMYEDFSADHANKTITIESHPHLPMQVASIHPCRHAETMKRLIKQLAGDGRELQVEQYLLVFLKFVQAIIPTVEYDFTKSIQL